ncbi:MAG: alpha/beta hydrolase [Neisseriaceae bacterium]|jgi:pimeloyl-ACP methyl ester carboxylesterase|nr:MAG: alpha/beta hydrolase [Neisseriaceae bacterium]
MVIEMNFELTYNVVKTQNGQAGYTKLGAGPNLVMIVGYSGTLFHWNRSFIHKLAESFTVYLLDNRYIGESTSSNESSILGLAHDVIDFIDALQIDKPIIFGWSMGGMITQELLANYSERFSGAVLLATTPDNRLVSQDFVELIKNQEHIPPHEFKMQLYATFFSEIDSEKIKLTIKDGAILIKDYDYRFNFEAKQFQDAVVASWQGSSAENLSRARIPVLVMRARNDLVIDGRAAEVFIDNINDSKLVVYPTGGHFFLHKAPLQVANDVANFFINPSI